MMAKEIIDEVFHEVAAHFSAINEASKNAVAALNWKAALEMALQNGGDFAEVQEFFVEDALKQLAPIIKDFVRRTELAALDQIAQLEVNEELG
jgi:hypothetical protein